MSDPKANQEPTMEEILASIRRIISEDGDGAKKEAEVPPPNLAMDPPKPAAVEPPAPPPPPPAPPPVEQAMEEDVLELTEVIAEQAPPPPPPVQAAPPPPPPPVFAPPPPPPASHPYEDLALVSNPVASEAASRFSDLASAVTAVRGMPVGNGTRTLEDIVKELLRPMLKDWLDQNLSTIVHRIVEREVAKLAGRVDDGNRR